MGFESNLTFLLEPEPTRKKLNLDDLSDECWNIVWFKIHHVKWLGIGGIIRSSLKILLNLQNY